MKKKSRPKLVKEIKKIVNSDSSNLDKIMIIKCLIDKNFEMKESDFQKILPGETLDCF